MKKIFLFCLMTLCFAAGCTDADNAQRVLTAQGYTDIELTGYSFFGCGQDDFKRTGFRARAPGGQPVEGVVCQGLIFKGATVRMK